MPDHTEEIERIERILNSGVRRHTVEGELIEYDLDALRQRLRELQAENTAGNGRRRRSLIRPNLGNF